VAKNKNMRRPNGNGSVYKLKGNRRNPWVATKTIIIEDGKQVRKNIGYFATDDEAMLALLTYKYNGNNAIDENITVKQAFKIVFNEVEKEGRSKSTLDILKASYKAIKPIESDKLAELTYADLQFLIDSIIEDENQKSSRSKLDKIKSLLSRMFDLLIKNKVQNDNPAKFISLRGIKEGEIPPFNDMDIAILFKNDDNRIAKSSLILAYTGLRIGEFLELRKFLNVDLKRKLIVGGNKTDAGKDRAIPMHSKILPYIQYFFNEFDNSEYLFSRDGDKVTTDYYRRFYHVPMVAELGISNLNPHSFRHTAASKFKMAGLDDKAITDMIGHTDIDFTNKRYVSVDEEYLHNQMQKVK